jgi:uncharacterized protein YycO
VFKQKIKLVSCVTNKNIYYFFMQLKILYESQLQPGDVLLCYSSGLKGKNEHLMQGYSHVAIFTSKAGVVEANSKGVNRTSVSELLSEYGHIAVLRNSELWSRKRLERLDDFLAKKIGLEFNQTGMYRVPERKEQQDAEIMTRVEGYFEGRFVPKSHDRNIYFCSELVTAAFIDVGIIDESASIIFSPETFSPEDIGRDKAFGFFIGYIKPYDDYQIPDDDNFRTTL